MKSLVPLTKAVLFSLVCFGMPGIAPAEDFLNGQLSVMPIPQPTTRTSSSFRDGTTHGYVEYRFAVNNKSDRPHRVTLAFGSSRGFGGDVSLSHASTSVVVEPKSEATAMILQPPVSFAFYNAPLEVRIDNRPAVTMGFSSTPHGNQRRFFSPSSTTVCNILVSNKISANQRELLTRGTLDDENPPEASGDQESAMGGMIGGPGMGMTGGMMGGPQSVDTHNVWQSEIPTDQWSDQWLGYTRFDCVAVNHEDMSVMKPEAFRALRRYVEMGGMLVVLDARSPQPPNWPKHWVDADASGGMTHYRALQGNAYVVQSGSEESGIKDLREKVLNAARRYNSYTQYAENSAETFENVAPLGILYTIPVRSLVVLVIFFALLIGPVNMLVLGFFKRRVWLIWTIPLTSVAASCLVLGLVVFSEGVKRVTSVKSATILDQRRSEAITWGIVGFYRTFAPPGGLAFSNSTEVTPVIGNMSGLSLGLQTFGEQQLTQNWIRPRIPAFFMLRKAAPSNVRLVFHWDGEPTVTNGLGVDVSDLKVVSPDGKEYTLDRLEAGKKGSLKLVSGQTVREEHTFFEVNSNFTSQLYRGSFPNQGRGTYTANIEGNSPFLEPGIDNMNPQTRENTIFGIFSGDGMPE